MTVPTRDLRVVWIGVPTEVRGPLTDILEQWGFLVPPWVETLAVQYEAVWMEEGEADLGAPAHTSAEPEYRQANVTVHGAWLTEPRLERERLILHELIHLVLAPMHNEHNDVVTRMAAGADGELDARFLTYAHEQWRRVLEGAVQDLRNALIHVGDVPPTVLRSENGSIA